MLIREQWIAYLQKERVGFETIFAKDIFSDWETCRQREKKAEDCLRYALELRYGQDETGLACKFLERCVLIADKVLAEQRGHTGVVQDEGCSLARADALEVKVLASAILGAGLDIAALCDAAMDFVTWALHERWDDQSEDAYLRAIRLLFIAGDLSKASELLRIRKKFKWHDDQLAVLRRLIVCEDRPIQNLVFLGEFDKVFNPLRSRYVFDQKAFTNVSMTRIELGAIRDKYFVSTDGGIDWDRAIDAIAQ